MASMAVYLRSRPRSFLRASAHACSSSPRFHFYSSSSSSPPDKSDENGQNTENAQSNSRFSFSDVKSQLRDRYGQSSRQPPPRQAFSFNQGTSVPFNRSTDEIRKNLSEFRMRSAAPSPPSGVQGEQSGSQAPLVSFMDLYKKMSESNADGKSESSAEGANPLENSFASVRGHLQRMNTSGREPLRRDRKQFSLSKLKETLNMRPSMNDSNSAGSSVIGGTSEGYVSQFGKELVERAKKDQERIEVPKNELLKNYTPDELGEKLRSLRPHGAKKGDDSFSLSELNERLIKLREMDLKDEKSTSGQIRELRDAIHMVQFSENRTDSNRSIQRIGMALQLGGTPSYMLEPPQEKLVEKYFHPDNMSAGEKLKLELKRVRDEFKMSETDCGSTRVQIAQLTTEILHLSKSLHKKDKHSRKGLHAKVQLRKKLLKYLRRTDWDSYCFILSKLGLRDNPGYKQ